MSGLGVHAGLALAGVVAGLPVAAAVQWRREPPAEFWSTVDCRPIPWDYVEGDLVVGHRIAMRAGACRITSSVPAGRPFGGERFFFTAVQLRPECLRRAGIDLSGGTIESLREYRITDRPTETDSVSGVMWHRIRLHPTR